MTTRKLLILITTACLLSLAAWARPDDDESARPDPQPGSGSTFYSVFPGGSSGSYLGIDPRDVTSDRLADLKLKDERGVEVMMVDQDGPAGKAGLQEHDVILQFNGEQVQSVEELRRMIHEIPAGRTVTLGISRDGQPMNLQVKLGNREEMKEAETSSSPRFGNQIFSVPIVPPMPNVRMETFPMTAYSRAGAEVENLTPQLGEFFGVRNGEGVLVRNVRKGTPAEAAGLRAGDVIVKAGGERISNCGDWSMALHDQGGKKVLVRVVRDKREQTISLTIPTSSDSSYYWGPSSADMAKLQDLMKHKSAEIRRATEQAQKSIEKIDFEKVTDDAMKQMRDAMRQLQDEFGDEF